MSKPDLDALLAYWQPRLRLADWDVQIRYTEQLGDAGQCAWSIKKKRSSIQIEDPISYPKSSPWPQDVEKTVVHELLHLQFAPYAAKDDTPEDIAQEQTIDQLARAFVELRRSKQAKSRKAPR